MTEITLWLESVKGFLQSLGFTVAGVSVVVLALLLLTGGSQSLQKGKAIAFGIFCGIGLLSFGSALVATLQG